MFVLICLIFSFYCLNFQSHRGSGFMKSVVFICLSPSMILPASIVLFTDVSLCFCPSLHLPLSVSNIRYLYRGVPLRLTLSHSSSLSLFHVTLKSVNYHIAKFVFHPLPKHFWHSLGLYCTEAVPTQQFNMQQSNATPGPSTPSSGCLPHFSFNEEVIVSFIPFSFSFPHSNAMKSACHQRVNAILTVIIFQRNNTELWSDIYQNRVISKPVDKIIVEIEQNLFQNIILQKSDTLCFITHS